MIQLAGPTERAPARRLGSIRRTTSLDLLPGDDGALVMSGRARDLVTRRDGSAAVVASGLLSLHIGPDRRVAKASLHPYADRASALVGRSVAAGFRTGVYRVLPEEYDAGSPLHLLLDDVAGGVVISGFTRRIAPDPAAGAERATRSPVARRLDVCIGWARDSDAARRLERTGIPPAPDWTPPAPDLYADDPVGSHTTRPLPIGGMRRARRLDVRRDDSGPSTLHAEVAFRDTFVDVHGEVRILHEYSARMTSRDGRVVSALGITPHVLPHRECPAGAASGSRAIGHPLTALRQWVSLEFFGPSTCTHLNDLLRGLSDVPTLDTTLTRRLHT
ncbi:DUF2889 domain-containing protein [Nostocoides vanveenii]|uniref:DUF2889 domain-containing protein n=1 Tax=Nostocoides vanveenii TaxID=330835 RepID=A0ABN2L2W3_9MICO